MQRRDFLKYGMAITALAGTSHFLIPGAAETAAYPAAINLVESTYKQNSTLFHSERMLVDYCTARSLKTPYFSHVISPTAGQLSFSAERLRMI